MEDRSGKEDERPILPLDLWPKKYGSRILDASNKQVGPTSSSSTDGFEYSLPYSELVRDFLIK